ncbi:DUF2279 domain-containing protein [Chryseolinea sp. H1M3-3]|uniref:DUF2279 domain-containing protein n=1 Tax=Chryseolinea sp. H1M3-3 TaxID=3034144 RepID=UPI0023EDDAFB|nr:DUF2279 domain-containing protein [Chryseolinea sp. H1M3-3]
MGASKRFLILIFFPLLGYSQAFDSTLTINKKRLRAFTIGGTVAYGATLAGLSYLWYSDAERQSFQFFNDNPEWKQVDKVGHFFSSFYFSYGTSRALQWCRVPPAKSDLIGSLVGFGVMLPIEILDGFSDAYGASTGDLIANAAGSAFFFGQSRLWNEIRIYPRFSFHRTKYAELRSDLLGNDLTSEILKDYNGQTFWLSVDMDKFLKFPKWLNFAVGYGAEGMVYARDYQNTNAGYLSPYRQYYFSVDFDLSGIKTKSKAVKTLLFLANMIKIPAPTIEFSNNSVKFRALYF